MAYLIGQILGYLASGVCLIYPFLKKKWMMLVASGLANGLVSINYLLIGKLGSAICITSLAVVQNIVSLFHITRETKIPTWERLVFLVLYITIGIYGMISLPGFVPEISLKNAIELLPIIGSILFTLAVFTRSEQITRMYTLSNAIVWLIYNICAGSSAFLSQVFTIISSVIALFAYRNENK